MHSLNEQTYAENVHLKIMGNLTSCVSFDKVAAFEREIKAKNYISSHSRSQTSGVLQDT